MLCTYLHDVTLSQSLLSPLQEICSHYWPAAGEKKQCGKFLTVELTDERAYEDYVHRDFKITFTDDVVSSTDGVCKLLYCT